MPPLKTLLTFTYQRLPWLGSILLRRRRLLHPYPESERRFSGSLRFRIRECPGIGGSSSHSRPIWRRLLSITTDLGRTAVVPENFGKGHINQHLAILRLKEMNPVFVAQQLASPAGQRQFVSLNRFAVKAGLNFDDIRCIDLLSPPIALQNKFSEIVAKLEKRTSVLIAASNESETLFSSLQQRAFRGEL